MQAKKEGHGKCRARIVVKVINLQRGTADAAALGGKPPCASTTGDMVVSCARHNGARRMPDMRPTHGWLRAALTVWKICIIIEFREAIVNGF